MKSILVATDGSPYSAEAVTFGVELAADTEAEVIFVHVVPAVDVVPVADVRNGRARSPTSRPRRIERCSTMRLRSPRSTVSSARPRS